MAQPASDAISEDPDLEPEEDETESDDYDEDEGESGDEESEEDGDQPRAGGLTALLLGDQEEDEDEDNEFVAPEPEPAPSGHPKKRRIEQVTNDHNEPAKASNTNDIGSKADSKRARV